LVKVRSTYRPSSDGGHNSFWCDARRDNAAAGDILPVIVVNKGGCETSTAMLAIDALDLPDDFIVTETPCGYIPDEGGVREGDHTVEREQSVKELRGGIDC
jgi:hypothetical protein